VIHPSGRRRAFFCSFLGLVDMLGSSFTDNTVASGFGLHLAQPILRKEWRDDLTVAEGKAILESCMKVLFYRDGRTINRVQFTTITAAGGVQIAEPVELETEWGYAAFREPGGASTGSW
jgi:20S proteasome subunit beta 7